LIVTISGRPGSGKSAVAKSLAHRLGLDHVSAGDFMRAMAGERGTTILELSRIAESDDEIDREIDARTVRLGEECDGFVMDARLAWHFLPMSIKVFLDVTPEVAAARIYGAGRATENENVDSAATRRAIEARIASERQRYRDYYGVDYLDSAQFDLVVDTSERTIEEVVDEIAVFATGTAQPERRDPGCGPGPL
jgi:cytidylate kinase